MMRGKLISIEGSEGAGKSTAVQFIKEYLTDLHKDIILTREPGGSAIAEEIRKIILQPHVNEAMIAETELLLMFASRAQHIHHCIAPALSAGKWVICDRYIDASYAYQGGGRLVDINKIQALDHWVVSGLYPDLTILLDIPVDLGLLRAEKRGSQKDRIEGEQLDFFIRVRNEYLKRAEHEPNRIRIIDASLDFKLVQEQIRELLDEFCMR